MLRVAVIGCGAAGLAALRHLTHRKELFQAVAFEQMLTIGGTWVYTDMLGCDSRGIPVHSSMYKNLRTNLPKETMAFPDFPFAKSLPSFMKHEDVRKYLEDYANHFQLHQYMKLGTVVEHVTPEIYNGRTIWTVASKKVEGGHQIQENFDAVVVCNGHYAVPLLPHIDKINEYTGQVLHSHDYRNPEDFLGKTVAILGAGASGQDILIDISKCAKKVLLCHNRDKLKTSLPSNAEQVSGIISMTEKGIVTSDGEYDADVLLNCTGYKYTFPFLSPLCHPSIQNERISNLYKHLIHTQWPTLSFLGIPKTICPFPMFDCQVRFVLASLEGTMRLPSEEEMEMNIKNDFDSRCELGMPERHAHTMGHRQWGYNDDLAELANFKPIPRVIRTLYDHVHDIRRKNLPDYKNRNYFLVDDFNFEETQ